MRRGASRRLPCLYATLILRPPLSPHLCLYPKSVALEPARVVGHSGCMQCTWGIREAEAYLAQATASTAVHKVKQAQVSLRLGGD